MTDALDRPSSILVLGGGSEIAGAIVRALAGPALRRVVLAGRPSASRDAAASALDGVEDVAVLDFDAADTAGHADLLDAVFARGDVDLVIVAFGVLGDQREFEQDPDAAVHAAQVNYVGAVSVCLRTARLLREQGHGGIVVLSSVAGERARRSNFLYGSTKAGVDLLVSGLGYALEGTGARAMVVRPGFVRSRMTEHLDPAPLSVTPDEVAGAVVRGLHRRAAVVYAPPAMRALMLALRHVPRPIFSRLPL